MEASNTFTPLNRCTIGPLTPPKVPPNLPKYQSMSAIGAGGAIDRSSECVFGIVAVRRSHYETTVDLILKRVEDLCQGRLKVKWLDIQQTASGEIVEDVLSKEPSFWEECDILWTLYSPELPLCKLKAYVERVKPLELNEVAGLMMLTDRSKTLKQCVKWKVAVPSFAECVRHDGVEPSVEDSEDHIVVDGTRIDKPFLEKPINSNDMDVFIYYPKHAGGGRMRLVSHGLGGAEFVAGRAHVRRTGSYVYQRFVPSEGFELRLFVIGSSYVHPEARQQLALNQFGDTGALFAPVLLEAKEKYLARKVALAFGLRTFNILALRTQSTPASLGADGKTNSREVFVNHIDPVDGGIPLTMTASVIEDIAQSLLLEIEHHHMEKTVAVKKLIASIRDSRIEIGDDDEDPFSSLPEEESSGSFSPPKVTCQRRELSAVVAVFRHGDRTPKQKLKLKLRVAEHIEDASFLLGMICGWILGSHHGVGLVRSSPAKKHELRAKEPLERLHDLLQEMRHLSDIEEESTVAKKENSKVASAALRMEDLSLLAAACNILETIDDVHAKIEIEKNTLNVGLKWGGQLTRTGEIQAINLGKKFRETQYSQEDMSHLHASFRHDLKVHSSNEPRCAMTAAAFAQGLLNLSCPLSIIQISFVRMDNLGRLDAGEGSFVHSPLAKVAKEKAHEMLESGVPIDENFESRALCEPKRYDRLRGELQHCQSEFKTVRAGLEELAKRMVTLEGELGKLGKCFGAALKSTNPAQEKLREIVPLVHQHWEDSVKEWLRDERTTVPAGFVADILDIANYDLRHTVPIIKNGGDYPEVIHAFEQVHGLAKCIAAIAEPPENGSIDSEKYEIARIFLRPLLTKLRFDLRVASGAELGKDADYLENHNQLYTDGSVRQVRSRLYFGHHSQMQKLLNLFMWAPQREKLINEAGHKFLSGMPVPLGYACHLVLKLWRHLDGGKTDRYTVSLELSPGDEGSSAGDDASVPVSAVLHDCIPLSELDQFLTEALEAPAVLVDP